jgi:hypothetical protein
MMEGIDHLWRFIMWGFGICASGFFVLLGIVLKTAASMTKPVREIRDALIGTLHKPGLLTKFYGLEEDVRDNKKICDEKHK